MPRAGGREALRDSVKARRSVSTIPPPVPGGVSPMLHSNEPQGGVVSHQRGSLDANYAAWGDSPSRQGIRMRGAQAYGSSEFGSGRSGSGPNHRMDRPHVEAAPRRVFRWATQNTTTYSPQRSIVG
jgi:hypothetical protein